MFCEVLSAFCAVLCVFCAVLCVCSDLCVCVCSFVQVHQMPSAPQLFGGCEDEEDGDEEEESSRFDIRPQFEGRAGQKVRNR